MIKQRIKDWLKKLPFAITQNQKYDRQTKKIIKKVCRENSNCIDVGCHKGEVLDIIRSAAPEGHHFGLEPIPDLYNDLAKKYKKTNCTIVNIAASNSKGVASFNYVVSNPSYSGLIKRKYDRSDEKDTTIEVRTDTIDNIIPSDTKIDLIKIDVEGGELLVLEGARSLLKRDHPIVIFEHGLGASEYYDSTPDKVYDLLHSCGLKVSLMKHWLEGKKALSAEAFKGQYYGRKNYYFIAHP